MGMIPNILFIIRSCYGESMPKPTQHYMRAAGLLIGALVAFLIFRSLMIPGSFGQYGHFRGDNLAEQMAKPVGYGERHACAQCHSDQESKHTTGKHQGVQCQDCHGPMRDHVEDDIVKGPMAINRSPMLCLRCHRALPSRPAEFPQIVVQDHYGVGEQLTEEGACLTCHTPHAPDLDVSSGGAK